MALTWTDDLSIGNAVIDSDHKALLEMASAVLLTIESENCPALSQAFGHFEAKLRTHFAYEENLARAVKFSYAQHKLLEQFFLREIGLLKEELLSRKCECCPEAIKHYSDTLSGLLINHISINDMQMKPTLQNYPYDYSPALT